MPFDQTNYNPLPIGHQRLLVLAEFLETKVPAKRFDLAVWANAHAIPADDFCGTTACACGWATTIPEFRALGLRLIQSEDAGCTVDIGIGGRRGWRAVEVFFDIGTVASARYLFDSEHYKARASAQDVADRIRAFVAEANATAVSPKDEIGAVGSEAAA